MAEGDARRVATVFAANAHRHVGASGTAKCDTHLDQLLWTVIMGDFTTIYLGLLNGVNPTPVDLVEKMKKELA